MQDAQIIIDEAKNAISQYCIEKCNAFCCRKGQPMLSGEEADLLCTDKRKELFLKEKDVFVSTKCPAIKENNIRPYLKRPELLNFNILDEEYFYKE